MYPCDDEMLISDLDQTEIHNSEHNGHEHEQGIDYCSPFCVCAITNVVEIKNNLFAAAILTQYEKINFIYLAPFSKETTADIFQPPRT